MENKKPVKEFRSKGLIKASIWENEGQNNKGETVIYYSVNIEKSYKDKDGNWKTSSTYFREDLPRVQLVAFKAFEWIHMGSQLNDHTEDDIPV